VGVGSNQDWNLLPLIPDRVHKTAKSFIIGQHSIWDKRRLYVGCVEFNYDQPRQELLLNFVRSFRTLTEFTERLTKGTNWCGVTRIGQIRRTKKRSQPRRPAWALVFLRDCRHGIAGLIRRLLRQVAKDLLPAHATLPHAFLISASISA